jgi:hypothetical protein
LLSRSEQQNSFAQALKKLAGVAERLCTPLQRELRGFDSLPLLFQTPIKKLFKAFSGHILYISLLSGEIELKNKVI